MTGLPAVLPRLRGLALMVYRVVFVAVFSLAVFSAVAATWYEARGGADQTRWVWSGSILGLGARIFPPHSSYGWRVAQVISAEAAQAGVKSGDVVVAVNGRPLPWNLPSSGFPSLFQAREGAKVVLALRGAEGLVRPRTLTWRAANVRTWFSGSGLDPARQSMARRLAYDLMSVFLLGPAAVLFFRRPHAIVAGVFAIAFCLISIGPTVEFWTAIGLARAHTIVSDLAFILLLSFGCAFPDGHFQPRWTRFSMLAAPLIYLPLVTVYGDPGPYMVFTAPAFVAMSIILYMRYRRLPASPQRQQFRWVALGLSVGVSMLLFRFLLVLAQGATPPGPIAPWVDFAASLDHALGFAVIGGGFAIALLRFRLYDAESLISARRPSPRPPCCSGVSGAHRRRRSRWCSPPCWASARSRPPR